MYYFNMAIKYISALNYITAIGINRKRRKANFSRNKPWARQNGIQPLHDTANCY